MTNPDTTGDRVHLIPASQWPDDKPASLVETPFSPSTAEQWRPVPGWEGYYEVSDHGRVRSLARRVKSPGRYVTHTRLVQGRTIEPNLETSHARVRLFRGGGTGKWCRVSRLVAAAFIDEIPPGMEVIHLNGDKSDNRPGNLKIVKPQEQPPRPYKVREPRTHCKRGHLLKAPNLDSWALKRGYRRCLSCANAHQKLGRGMGDTPEFQATADAHYLKLVPDDGSGATAAPREGTGETAADTIEAALCKIADSLEIIAGKLK